LLAGGFGNPIDDRFGCQETTFGWQLGRHREKQVLAGIHACLGNDRAAKEALAVFLQNSPGESISKQRMKWAKIWTAPGSLDRWIEHMRIAGLPE
jgi:hypothetical protein